MFAKHALLALRASLVPATAAATPAARRLASSLPGCQQTHAQCIVVDTFYGTFALLQAPPRAHSAAAERSGMQP